LFGNYVQTIRNNVQNKSVNFNLCSVIINPS